MTNHVSKSVAFIKEEDCIGCTHCVTACPFDAIIGAAKHMHSVIPSFCIGCKLCVAPCPVDCIEMIENPSYQYGADKLEQKKRKIEFTSDVKQRAKRREQRIASSQNLKLDVLADQKNNIDSLLAELKASTEQK